MNLLIITVEAHADCRTSSYFVNSHQQKGALLGRMGLIVISPRRFHTKTLVAVASSDVGILFYGDSHLAFAHNYGRIRFTEIIVNLNVVELDLRAA